MAEDVELPRKAMLRGGALGGVTAGSAMLASAIIYAGATGTGFWTPVRLIAASMHGDPALIEGGQAWGGGGMVEVVLTAVIIHFTFAAGWGIAFVRLFKRLSGSVVLAVGLLYGLAVWALMTWGVLIWADPTMYDRVQLAGRPFLFEHLLYGGFIALAPGLARRYSRRVPDDRL